jgi:fermentation-respiration switch protein FrsA (DUF1100 family)
MSLKVFEGKTYRASPPTSQTPGFFSDIRTKTWNICTTISLSNFLHDKILSLFNPQTQLGKPTISELRAKLLNSLDHPQIVHFRTPRGVEIEGAYFPARFESEDKKAIIFAMEAGGTYEKVADPEYAGAHFTHFFREQFGNKVGLLIINYEGIAESVGTRSLDNWATDLYSAYDYLNTQGFNEILFYGHSLGGHLSMKAIQKIFQKYKTLPPIVSDRSFYDITTFIYHYSGGGTTGRIAQAMMLYSGLNSQVAALDAQRMLVINAEDDPIVAFPAAMAFHFEESSNVEKLIISGEQGNYSAHTRMFNEQEKQKVVKFINTALNL